MNLDNLQRLDELRRYELFDDGPDPAFNVLAELAAHVCDAPIGYISFVDERSQRLLARWGVPPEVSDRIPREESICACTIGESPLVLVVEDLETDGRFKELPVVGALGLCFYAGASLVTPSGFVLGSVCVVDRRQRTLTPPQMRSLALVRDQVMELLESRRALGELRRSESLRQEAVEALVATQQDLQRRIELRTREIEEVHRKKRELLERIGDGYLALDRQMRFVYVNERAAQIFGRSADELIGKTIDDTFAEGLGRPFRAAYERALAEQQMVTVEARYSLWDRWFESRMYPSADGVAIFFTEITQRKEAEAELERSRARLIEAQRVAHVGSWEWDVGSDEVSWSDELYRIYGLPIGSSLGGYQAFLGRVHPDNLEATKRVIGEAIERGGTFIYDHHIVRPDGSIRMLHTRGEAVLDDGKIARLIGCCWDVTELRETTSALERTVALLQATLEVTADGVLVVDAAGAVGAYNQPMATLFALPPAQTGATTLAQIAARLQDPEPLVARSRSVALDEAVDMLALRDGRTLEARSRPHIVDGRVAGRVWSFRLAPTA